MKIKKNDSVIIISGNYKGKTGKVLKVFPKKKRALVEGVNLIKKHSKPSQQHPQGGIVEKEASVNISNLMVIAPDGKPTRIGKKILEDGSRVRICKRTNEMIDK
ncbi:50S ribosomal protein L24 [candidate division KSB1 bacterium]